MGMIPARAWDTEGVTWLRALQAPFLITSNDLVGQVVKADMAKEMLSGLDKAGVIRLALVPECRPCSVGVRPVGMLRTHNWGYGLRRG
jgi:C4-dicarboxylate-binding protein DctP